jgi:NAD(P)-dependent dehydrogenase (short-subunit alcohol dehydrogenase family)
MDLGLKDKTALVTGAGRGIGRAIAMALAREGVSVALVSRTLAELERVAAEVREIGGHAVVAQADVSKRADIERVVEIATKDLGRVDVLINNAGGNVLGRIAELDPDEWWNQFEVNIRGPYLLCRSLVPRMVERRWGRVINMSSVAGKVGMLYCTSYCASKHALLGFTKALALEVADRGVTVNAVCPGFVETALTESTTRQRSELFGQTVEQLKKGVRDRSPQKTIASPEDVAEAVLFLASEQAKRTTGEAFNVSCGTVMH